MHGVRSTFLAGQQRRTGTGADENLVFLLGHIGDRKCYRGIRKVEDGIDAFVLVPSPRDRHAHVCLVLMVGRYDLDLLAGGLAAVIFNRHLRGDDRADTLVGRKHARLIVEHADPDAILSLRSGYRECAGCEDNKHRRTKNLSHGHPPRLQP